MRARSRRKLAKAVKINGWGLFSYRGIMAAMATAMIGGGTYGLQRIINSQDDVRTALAVFGERMAKMEGRQDKFEYIITDFSKKFDDLQKDIRRLQK